MNRVGRRLKQYWWLIVVVGLVGAAATFALIEVRTPNSIVSGVVNTRPAAQLPTDRIDLIEDLTVGVAQPSTIRAAAKDAGVDAAVSTDDVTVERIGASSVARVSLAWDGDGPDGETMLRALVKAAARYVLGNPTQTNDSDQLRKARADAAAARSKLAEAIANNGGVSPRKELQEFQRQISDGTSGRERATLLRLLEDDQEFAQLQEDAKLAEEAVSAANQIVAESRVTTARSTSALVVEIDERPSDPSSSATAFRRALASGLLAALVAAGFLVVTELRRSNPTLPRGEGSSAGGAR